jgi:hypothetical protein
MDGRGTSFVIVFLHGFGFPDVNYDVRGVDFALWRFDPKRCSFGPARSSPKLTNALALDRERTKRIPAVHGQGQNQRQTRPPVNPGNRGANRSAILRRRIRPRPDHV